MNTKIIGIVSVVVICVAILVGAAFLLTRQDNRPDVLDAFAQCLKDKDASFYGAYWCPHCQAQKALFGRSARLLPYVECAEGEGQSQVCTDKKITGYPTWIFADGSRLEGEVPLAILAEKSGCILPAGFATTTAITSSSTPSQ